jgi:hypothetical protein
VHPIGLHSVTAVVPLYKGKGDTINGSMLLRSVNVDESELVQVQAASTWAAENEIDRIDVLKVDVEGCEVEVLTSLAHLLPTVKVLYVEYDSRSARRAVERLVDHTHELYSGKMFLDQGECIFLRNDFAGLDAAREHVSPVISARLSDRDG